jgi:signal transduction histidine kinase
MKATPASPNESHAGARPDALRGVLVGFALLLGPLSLLLLRMYPGIDYKFQSPALHFWLVSGIALLAILMALLILRAAVVRRDGRALLVGLAFLTLSSMFLVHAVSTPSMLFMNTRHATQWSTPLALLSSGILLALSTNRRIASLPTLIVHWRRWFLLGFAIWVLYVAFMLFYVPAQSTAAASPAPAAAHVEHDEATDEAEEYAAASVAPAESSQPAPAAPTVQQRLIDLAPRFFPFITALNLLLFGFAAIRYGLRWRRTPTRPLASLAIGSILLAETALAAQYGVTWQASFWSYHVLLMAAVLVVTYGVVRGAERSGSLSGAVEGVLLGATIERQRHAFQDGMDALLGALENGDRAALPELRRDLSSRFGLASDQLDLLQHAVAVVAQDREQGRRLQALVDISHTVTSDLDRDKIIENVVTTLSKMTNARLAAVGIIEDDQLHIAGRHRVINGVLSNEALHLPAEALPLAWLQSTDVPYNTVLDEQLAPLAVDDQEVLMLPLSHHTSIIGVLIFEPQGSQEIDSRVEGVLQSVASHLATALVNDRLYRTIQADHERILQSEQTKEEMNQLIVHDLKNPLTAIINYLDLLKRDSFTPSQYELIDGAWRSSRSMITLVSDLLDSSRLREGRLSLRLDTISLAQMLERCIGDMRSWAAQEHKTIQLLMNDSEQQIAIDADLFSRVITNLLSNAIKHTPAASTIEVRARRDDENIVVEVHDNGPGIPAELQPTLFERFSSAARASSNGRQRNTGLGLYFCKLAVEAHGGTISVHSHPSTGTTFMISLPSKVAATSDLVARSS